MSNNKRPVSFYSFHLLPIVIIAVIVIGSFVVIGKSSKSDDVLGKKESTEGKENNDNDKEKSSKSKNNKENDKDTSQEQKSQKQEEKENNKETGLNKKNEGNLNDKLEEVVENEEEAGNVEVSKQLEQTAQVIEQDQQEVEETVDELEKRPKWQTLLFGTDYKNLGALRSQLVRNRNTIRKLTRSLDTLESSESEGLVQGQIYDLEASQLEIKEIIEKNESQFSILGWVFRFLSGYDSGGGGDDTGESSESTEATPSF